MSAYWDQWDDLDESCADDEDIDMDEVRYQACQEREVAGDSSQFLECLVY